MDRQKTVLIVEDEKNIVDILRFNLQREGYQTLEAYDGEDGLNKARSEKPDLILLDVMLPRMNGFDVCRALRQAGDAGWAGDFAVRTAFNACEYRAPDERSGRYGRAQAETP